MAQKFNLDKTIAVIGLGYVGMPLALALSDHMKVIGFDVDQSRIDELLKAEDRNLEVGPERFKQTSCIFTAEPNSLDDADIYIVTVPTPLTADNEPDLSCLESATKLVGPFLKADNIVVYESTVYPGVTEDYCGSILEKESGLVSGKDFWLGYSPERINPGDKKHTVQTITKVVSGQTEEITELLAEIYGMTNNGNIFKAKNIKTAEASKVIENAQRDINVAFVNEVTKIMNSLDLSIYDVLEAAKTKWNFLPFTPGLVGGHCIGVDPYYLSHCAEKLGHDPMVILSGRETNNNMGAFIASRLCEEMGDKKAANILILGFTFKENINDIRNTKVVDVYNALRDIGHSVDVHDSYADPSAVTKEYGIEIMTELQSGKKYDSILLAVAHNAYQEISAQDIQNMLDETGIIFDMKGLWRDSHHEWGNRYRTL